MSTDARAARRFTPGQYVAMAAQSAVIELSERSNEMIQELNAAGSYADRLLSQVILCVLDDCRVTLSALTNAADDAQMLKSDLTRQSLVAPALVALSLAVMDVDTTAAFRRQIVRLTRAGVTLAVVTNVAAEQYGIDRADELHGADTGGYSSAALLAAATELATKRSFAYLFELVINLTRTPPVNAAAAIELVRESMAAQPWLEYLLRGDCVETSVTVTAAPAKTGVDSSASPEARAQPGSEANSESGLDGASAAAADDTGAESSVEEPEPAPLSLGAVSADTVDTDDAAAPGVTQRKQLRSGTLSQLLNIPPTVSDI